MELEIHDLAKEEVYRGWIRIPEAYRRDNSSRTIPEASIVRLACKGRSILVIVRGDVDSHDPTVRIESLYKDKLGLKRGDKANFELRNAWFFDRCKYYWSHPDPATAFTMMIAIISLCMGLVGLVLGVISLR